MSFSKKQNAKQKKFVKKLIITAGSLTFGLMNPLFGNPVDFSTGFVEGSLDGQNDWETAGGSNIQVTADGGVVDGSFSLAVLTTASSTVNPGDSFTSTIDFTFSVLSDINDPDGLEPRDRDLTVGPLVNATFTAGSVPADNLGNDGTINNRLAGSLNRSRAGYRLILAQDWGGTNPTQNGVNNQFANSPLFDYAEIGLDPVGSDPLVVDVDEDLVSDELQLSLTLTAGLNTDDWSAEISLTNLTTGVVVASDLRTNLSFDVDPASGGEIFGGFGFGQGNSNVEIDENAPRTVSRYEFIVTPVDDQDVEVNFTEAEGFNNGPLAASNFWSVASEGTVMTEGTGNVNVAGFSSMIYQPNSGIYIEGATYSASIDFRFTDTATVDTTTGDVSPPNKPLLGASLFNGSLANEITGSQFPIMSAEVDDNGFVTITTTEPHGLNVGDQTFVSNLDFVDADPNGFVNSIEEVPSENVFLIALANAGSAEVYGVTEDSVITTSRAISQIRAGLNRGNRNYVIRLQSGWKSFATAGTLPPSLTDDFVPANIGQRSSAVVADTLVGIDRDADPMDLESDLLRLTITLVAGDTPSAYLVQLAMFNLNTDPNLENPLVEEEIGPITNFEASQLFGGFGGGQSDNNARVENRLVDAFRFTVTLPEDPTTPDNLTVNETSFDGTTLSLSFSGDANTSYRLATSPDLETAFTNLEINGSEVTANTDANGEGVFSVTVPTPVAARNFFRIEENQ